MHCVYLSTRADSPASCYLVTLHSHVQFLHDWVLQRMPLVLPPAGYKKKKGAVVARTPNATRALTQLSAWLSSRAPAAAVSPASAEAASDASTTEEDGNADEAEEDDEVVDATGRWGFGSGAGVSAGGVILDDDDDDDGDDEMMRLALAESERTALEESRRT